VLEHIGSHITIYTSTATATAAAATATATANAAAAVPTRKQRAHSYIRRVYDTLCQDRPQKWSSSACITEITVLTQNHAARAPKIHYFKIKLPCPTSNRESWRSEALLRLTTAVSSRNKLIVYLIV
jgi:hypothetical protein